ncbi:MAG: DMT family transporter [Burkholderiaceae bacterium]
MTSLSRKDWLLLVFLTLIWGANWPVMKIAVHDFPPITFRLLSVAGGALVLWAALRVQRLPLAIPRGQFGTVLKLAIPNVLMWQLFIILGVKMLSSGRAAILGYTMPVWAVLSGLIFFHERVTRLAWLGVGCALAGALLLLSSEFENLSGQPLGSLMALIAAASWGFGTVLMKRTRLDMPTAVLTMWTLVIGSLLLLPVAVLFEHAAWRAPNAVEWAAIAFNAVLALATAQLLWFRLARTLPPVASSLSVMMIPVLGIFLGAWWLHETPHWPDYVAALLILLAMSTVLLKPRTATLT